jgi:HSP20 family protein
MGNNDEKNNDEKGKKSDIKDEDLETKVQELGNRIKELEQRLEESKATESEHASFVGDIVGSIPSFGRIVKILEKTSPEFRQKIAETDLEIKHRLETGWSSKPVVSYGLSIRPLSSRNESSKIPGTASRNVKNVTVEAPEPTGPIFDVFEKQNSVYVIAQIPDVEEKDINIEIQGNMLNISAGIYNKKISLPCKSGSIEEKSYRNGVLQLKIKRENNDN